MMRKLKHYIEDNCGNDAAVLLSSGFQAAQYTRNRAPLISPSIVDLDIGNSGEIVLKLTPIARARCYEVRMATVGSGNTPGPWQTVYRRAVDEDHRPHSWNHLCIPGACHRRSYRL